MRYWVMMKSAYKKEHKQANKRINEMCHLKLHQSIIGRNDRLIEGEATSGS
jgi:hypothetical protein